ncbi:ribonucleotide reductase of class Ia (aerobic), alpha subunit [Pseudomonas phage vB_PaeM_VL12]|uniref:Putative ribonucleotide reductase n=1 Tax=Pseudomonas phage vB_PaeM_G1 TaxID=1983539 RepID=A0A218L431_9CAUD|nr:ribonucleotide-diphosphate reductase subunit alpha [Pseudomonas aeruginosa]YP_009604745.1 ribonucleotide reductase [Pseudomonas phage vB_PaeM_G1]ARW57385.1 putative ribonucleotide reductase [Pseudomonas phage vB_PaeM_G1]UKM53905.1 ribonucleotide reductase of class Ia (aerobic), alpha subunit [Pseudomonas phage vB_PaeM_VL12]UVD32821.1 ribonucleotide reductase of class Ia (aerobic), alpha subunit [Pseudomonas phage PH826]
MSESVQPYNGILIDYSLDRTIPEQGLAMLTSDGFYKKEHETSPQQTLSRAAVSYCFGDYDFAQRMYGYFSRQWAVPASPVQTNALDIEWPNFTEEQFDEAGDWLQENIDTTGMPISCFLSMISDSRKGLTTASGEAKELSMAGGGVGVYAGIRAPDELSTGVIEHAGDYDVMCRAYRQTRTRRGSMAMYLDVAHPEFPVFLQMRNPVGGDPKLKRFNLNNGANIPDAFMEAVIKGEDWEFVDPKHGKTGRKVPARELWEEMLQVRKDTGEPFMLFVDTVNRNLPECITHPLYRVRQSNLCSEITLYTSFKRTAVCCLSSVNLGTYDEWKDDPLFIADMVRFLDNVLEFFIRLAPPSMHRAVHSASKERAIGLGTMGFHTLLQQRMIPFESGGMGGMQQLNYQVYKQIKEQAVQASLELGRSRGEAPDCQGSGRRNSHLLAIAPNANSSSLVNVSPSTEPWAGNCFNAQGRAGSFLIKNEYLRRELEKVGLDTKETWRSINDAEGSCQHIEGLSDEVKAVFKTIREISPMWLIEAAAGRQPFICQSQSVNLYVHPDITLQEMSDIHIYAWHKGLKSLYYCRSKAAKSMKVGTGGAEPLNALPVRYTISLDEDTCLSCQG